MARAMAYEVTLAYEVTFSIFTAPLPATVPCPFTSRSSPKRSRPLEEAFAAVTFAENVAESPLPSFTAAEASSTVTEPSVLEKNASR